VGLVENADNHVDKIDVQSLRVIRAIADLGSVTRAAQELGFSQPAISQQLKKIEARLGIAVVHKIGRSLRLTEAGEVLARYAVTVNSALRAASDELSDLAGTRRGSVSLSAFPSASSTIVPALLRQLGDRYPGILVNFREAEPPEAIGQLYDGVVDLAITFRYPGDRADPHLTYGAALTTIPLWTDEMVLVLPAGHRLAQQDSVDVRHLADEKWIAGCPLCRGNLLSVCSGVGFEPTITHETDNTFAVVALVAAGLGVALIPRLALAGSAAPEGVRIVRTTGDNHRTINLVALADYQRVPSNLVIARMLGAMPGGAWHLSNVGAKQ
jgi:DNA-binding transcriptional LysR family regulator